MSMEVIKEIWPEWSVVKRIGGGAYGTVFEVIRNEYGVENHAAVKVISIPESEAEIDTLRADGLSFEETKAHFQEIVNDFVNEIKLMLSLEGRPNIVTIRDYKVVEKREALGWNIFLLMELLIPFAEYTSDHQLSENEVIKLGCDICTALETCAHENIIHRDIKPGNILVHKSGAFKLGDFGIARKLENMTDGLSKRYTPKYMAPEVATSKYYDERVDIYSLGIVLYELLNGRCIPFQQNKQIKSISDIENAVLRRNSGEALPAPCMASPAMADLILRACAHNPDMRFASATEMKRALMSVANGTYQMACVEAEDKTVSIRKKPADYDETTCVRKAPSDFVQKVGAFADAPVSASGSAPKKRGKLIAILAAILVAVLILTVGVLAAVKMINSNDDDDSDYTSKKTTELQHIASKPSTTKKTTTAKTSTTRTTTTKTTTTTKKTTTKTTAGTVLKPIERVSDNSIIGASSSSFLTESGVGLKHKAERVLDGKLETSWVEGASSDGIGESLTIRLDKERLVSGITIYPGYQKSAVLYKQNSRPREIQIIFSDGSYFNSVLNDAMKGQTISFDRSVVTSRVTIKIVSVYDGSVFDDTAIAEVSLF